jgi:hypothetical protein
MYVFIKLKIGKTKYDPKFEREIKWAIMENYAHHVKNVLAEGRYVPAPDMGTGPNEMVVIYNQTRDPSTVTGKPEGIPSLSHLSRKRLSLSVCCIHCRTLAWSRICTWSRTKTTS